jgi:2-polyprenyl-6-hydroxyphenyl methylase/3-demethylubiquinone-9 3-methyltransferase
MSTEADTSATLRGHADEVRRGDRFEFGENWRRFLSVLDEERIAGAERSLKAMLGSFDLRGKTFLDVGSGSGLSSLVARRLGARVRSFDYDPSSVACTAELKSRYFPSDPDWTVEAGSALDREYLAGLGTFDCVYSWGVLHHTGSMWQALENVMPLVRPGGLLFIAIYNDQGWISRYWLGVKRVYNTGPVGRAATVAAHFPYHYLLRYAVRAATGRLPLERGMSLWHDMLDWLGGFPFEVAKPEAIFRVFRDRGFVLENLSTCRGRMGCNEFVFRKIDGGARLSEG